MRFISFCGDIFLVIGSLASAQGEEIYVRLMSWIFPIFGLSDLVSFEISKPSIEIIHGLYICICNMLNAAVIAASLLFFVPCARLFSLLFDCLLTRASMQLDNTMTEKENEVNEIEGERPTYDNSNDSVFDYRN